MMNKALRWMKGYVHFTAQVPDMRRVLDAMRTQELRVWALSAGEISLSGAVRARDYCALAKCIHKFGGKSRVVKRHGFPFVCFRNRKRYGLLLGGIFFIAFLLYSQTFLWEIRLPDCEPEVAQEVLTLLEEHGVKKGVPLAQLDEKKLQQEMLQDTPLFSWIALNFAGTAVNVVFAERVQPPVIDPDTPCNIVAKKAGQILYIEAKHGTETVLEKEVVLPGDLLISGVSAGTESKSQHAEGRVIAATLDVQTRSFSLRQEAKQWTGEATYGLELSFFGFSLPVWNQIPESDYEEVVQKYPLVLFGHELPVSATVLTRESYKLTETQYSKEQAVQFMEQSLTKYEQEELQNTVIKEYHDEIELVDGICYFTRRYHCEEDIAQKIGLSVNEQ